VPDPTATLRRGAIAPWAKSTSPYYAQTLEALGKHFKFRLDQRGTKLPGKGAEGILYGTGASRCASPMMTAARL
jgi:excinuclease ABC subunit A